MRTVLKATGVAGAVLIVAGVVAVISDIYRCPEPSFDEGDYDYDDDDDFEEEDSDDEDTDLQEQSFEVVTGVSVDDAITAILGNTDKFREEDLRSRDIQTLAKTYFSYCEV